MWWWVMSPFWIFLLFLICYSLHVAVNICINCSFYISITNNDRPRIRASCSMCHYLCGSFSSGAAAVWFDRCIRQVRCVKELGMRTRPSLTRSMQDWGVQSRAWGQYQDVHVRDRGLSNSSRGKAETKAFIARDWDEAFVCGIMLRIAAVAWFFPLKYSCHIFVDWVVSLSLVDVMNDKRPFSKLCCWTLISKIRNAVEFAIKWLLTNWQMTLNKLVVV